MHMIALKQKKVWIKRKEQKCGYTFAPLASFHKVKRTGSRQKLRPEKLLLHFCE